LLAENIDDNRVSLMELGAGREIIAAMQQHIGVALVARKCVLGALSHLAANSDLNPPEPPVCVFFLNFSLGRIFRSTQTGVRACVCQKWAFWVRTAGLCQPAGRALLPLVLAGLLG
jgi:hypothetical protein